MEGKYLVHRLKIGARGVSKYQNITCNLIKKINLNQTLQRRRNIQNKKYYKNTDNEKAQPKLNLASHMGQNLKYEQNRHSELHQIQVQIIS